jgi:hypothetical protein
MPNYNPALPLVFNHVPKTSGLALRTGITQAIRAERVVEGFDLSLYGDFPGLGTVAPEIKATIYFSAEAMPRDARWIAGHFALSTTVKAYPSAQHLTVLREARTRILSHWMFWRSLGDDIICPWGEWARVVWLSHGTLASFLSDPAAAPQTDNAALRNLLWPHELLPRHGFIDPRNDDALLAEATAKLDAFAHVDVVENPAFEPNLRRWFDLAVPYPKVNQTLSIPVARRVPLEGELTPSALARLGTLGRLDDRLWMRVARRSMSAAEASILRQRTFTEAKRRYAQLMADEPKVSPAT